jgi:peptide/nickel transport system permease protein
LATATWASVADVCRHLALPAIVLAVGLLPILVRHVRASVLDVLNAPFIVAARARGVPRGRLLFRAALRAAAAPLVALLGLSVANLLSVSLLVEVITGWPGLGPLLVEATRSRDMPVVGAALLSSCTLLAIGALVADAGVRLADPRVRLSSVRAPRVRS